MILNTPRRSSHLFAWWNNFGHQCMSNLSNLSNKIFAYVAAANLYESCIIVIALIFWEQFYAFLWKIEVHSSSNAGLRCPLYVSCNIEVIDNIINKNWLNLSKITCTINPRDQHPFEFSIQFQISCDTIKDNHSKLFYWIYLHTFFDIQFPLIWIMPVITEPQICLEPKVWCFLCSTPIQSPHPSIINS